ncbi:type I-E CRISPR-associated protein Cse1/CasA [Jatrophihabitans lederbergiae]|uniref:Type I-E CRISPR-associated protein Cse1/CasA n=1 Tax=Jatrophihabitans lederbergiae TaxID=3075547 RepID=A0ABU2J647_9ACTN|nr:type I-E CRISPR-associated protein Cse1/CasA [Jatrophihabitans sp. DSM 44399]MDT0260064.1 type I-E CRISPR-associated protein Cse1/CasA [Jatrophihabitans sp. DSM 44399]
MNTSTPAFDLTTQPWVMMHLLDGTTREVSLADAFALAPQARAITGELSTTGFAVTRLLLAILYRAIGGTVTSDSWKDLWTAETLPISEITDYLARHRDRFDLLSTTAPFFQVADLHTSNNEVTGLESLIADVPNGIPFQTTRSGTALASIGLAEAARWVVHAQAFETSGIKSAAVGDDRVKAGKGYPIGTGWAGGLGGLFAEGSNLRETLLLNLVGYQREAEADPDLPPWETQPQTAAAATRPYPLGPVSAYTWQKARIRLAVEGERVTGVLIANGDRAVLVNQYDVEPMTGWYYSENQAKATGKIPYYLPARHDPGRSFWRGIASVLPNVTQPQSSSGNPRSRVPGVVQWLSKLSVLETLPGDFIVRLHAVGVVYGTQNATVAEIIDDAYSLNLVVLSEDHPQMGRAVEWAVDVASKVCWALGILGENIAKAEVGDAPGDSGKTRMAAARAEAAAAGYAALDAPFRTWVASLHDEPALPAARAEWSTTVRRVVRNIAAELARTAPPQTVMQRPMHLMCIPLAQKVFDQHLNTYLPRTDLPTTDSQTKEPVHA